MNVLFLCARNRRRSPTAEELFRNWPGIETASAGLADDAECPLDSEMVEWSDLILVMEKIHLARLRRRHGPMLKSRRVVSLDIPDDFEAHAPELITLLQRKVPPFLGKASGSAKRNS